MFGCIKSLTMVSLVMRIHQSNIYAQFKSQTKTPRKIGKSFKTKRVLTLSAEMCVAFCCRGVEGAGRESRGTNTYMKRKVWDCQDLPWWCTNLLWYGASCLEKYANPLTSCCPHYVDKARNRPLWIRTTFQFAQSTLRCVPHCPPLNHWIRREKRCSL